MRPSRRRGRAGLGNLIDRRGFLRGSFRVLVGTTTGSGLLSASARSALATSPPTAPADSLEKALEKSAFVYVSPLKANGEESTCHGEVWFGGLEGGAVLITATSSWKAKSLARGLNRARVWVGDHGRWKGWLSNHEDFRVAPWFDARAERVRDDAMLERLLALFEQKYPAEIDAWREKMRSGYRDGTRILIRYARI